MPAFEYRAVDANGAESNGILDGDSARQIRSRLRDRDLFPLEVREVAGRRSEAATAANDTETTAAIPQRREGLNADALALITRQLATLVRAGTPLSDALAAVSEQTESKKIRRIVLAVRARVQEGHSLADALAAFPRAFPDLYRATVTAGEQSGKLDGVLERLAEFTEARQVLRQKVGLAMIYPAVLVVLSLLVIGILMAYVVPKVVSVFSHVGDELPLATRVLINTSDFTRDYGLFVLALLIVAGVATRWFLNQEGPRRRFHAFTLRLWVIGKLQRGADAARFSRTLSILVGAGVPVLEALRIASEVMRNVVLREGVIEAARRVREGVALSDALRGKAQLPPMLIHLIASGEQSGQLGEMLERAAVNQERELETAVATFIGVFEPLLIVAMGGIVLFIVMAIMLPILQMNDLAL
jgi:general secretion pathway protein F